jgi:asparagine synthase (glutamine-hydrolysing)
MCGIIAITSSRGKSYDLAPSLEAIRHRGPDGRGEFVSDDGDCHLGHVRLSIIDLTQAGHQPMEDSTGRFVISYNGEVYNFQFLKEILNKKYGDIAWRSTTDTEVILEGFSREGLPFLSKLNGIFALALYDKKERILYCLRDPLGIKPLYWSEQFGSVFFSSELKGILKHFGLKRTLRRQSMADQLAFMYVPEPHTLYQEFYKLEPGICFLFREGKKLNSVSLFDHLQTPLEFSSEKEIIERFRETFSTAVQRQLVADVPISLFLSGGIDSSAVATEVVRSKANMRNAFTISFSSEDNRYDGQSDDMHYAKIVADRLGLKLRIIEAHQNFISLLPSLSDYLEDGLADPAAINTYLICKSARETGVKVMLSGQGADECLGGYRRYLAMKKLQRVPTVVRKALSFVGGLLPISVPGRFNGLFRRFKKFSTVAGLEATKSLLALYTWNDAFKICGLFKDSSELTIGQDLLRLFEKYKGKDLISAMISVDQKFDLMSLNLSYTDKMSMMVGVEARVPFLDFDLIRLMHSIPTDLKIKGTVQKYLLKKAMEPHLPKEVIYRQKAGFGLPLRSWFRKEHQLVQDYFSPERIRTQGIFEVDALQTMCQEQFSGKKDHTNTLFSMLALQIWLDRC